MEKRIDDKLHGKVYIFKKLDTPFSAIITSANLTQHGLKQNHELTDKDFKEQHFAKQPRAVRINDILITYAVGVRKIISVFQMTSQAKKTNIQNDRWPWYLEVKNLAKRLGETWSEKSLIVTDIVRLYAEKYDRSVTQRGGFDLKGLRRGNDKIQLTDEFGRYLFDIAMRANEE